MRAKVYKYDAPIEGDLSIEMPRNSIVMCVQMQLDTPRIWAIVDPDAETEERRFHWCATGEPVDDMGAYVGTVQSHAGRLVFHLFESAL